MEKVFVELKEFSAEIFPDVNLAFSGFEVVKSGWAVTLKGAQNFEGEIGMIQAIEVALRTSKTVCVSRLDGRMLWDVVVIFDHEQTATFFAKKTEQMFIYQIETGHLKWLI